MQKNNKPIIAIVCLHYYFFILVAFFIGPRHIVNETTMTEKIKVITISKASEVPRKPIDGKPTLVYWDIVGIAHPLRMALALADIEWCDVRIVCGQSSDSKSNKTEWFAAKSSLQKEGILDFPNLPFYLDETVALVQSDAILRYLGEKHNLMGRGNVPEHLTDMLMEEARDLDSTIIRLSYEEGGAAVAKFLCSEELRKKLDVWEGLIRKSEGAYVTGPNITAVDLKLYTFLYKFQHAQATLAVASMMAEGANEEGEVPSLPFWVPAYLEQVETTTPQLKAYLKGPDMQIPTNNPHARFENY